MHRPFAAILSLALLLVACTSDEEPPPDPTEGSQVVVALASSDHYVGAPQRVSVGLPLHDGRLVSFGSVDMAFSYVGTADEEVAPQPGPSATAVYLPTPGTPEEPGGPAVTNPSEGRGVYQAEGVTFDRAGFWEVAVSGQVAGLGAIRATTTIPVLDDPAYPAPGQPALKTRNLTLGDAEDVPLAAIDSGAFGTGQIPDPELHEWTIARAIQQGRPALVIFSTPTFCESQFCGPVTDVVADLASRFFDRAVFIHVEIWRNRNENAINQAAADWLFRDGGLTEPWLYLIGADGVIVDRWATLFRQEQVVAALEALPPMRR